MSTFNKPHLKKPHLKKPKAILFDLDGTLVDTAPDFYGVVNSLRLENSLAPLDEEIIRQQVSNGGVALACLAYEVTADHPAMREYRQNLLDRYQQQIGQYSALFDGYSAVLADLDKSGIAWSVVTNKPRLYTDLLLPRLQLTPVSVVCPEDVKQSKPAPDALLLSATQLGVDPELCWYVGDHRRDMVAARSAGMLAIAANYGYVDDEDPAERWPADIWIDQPSDLTTLIAQSSR